MYMQAVLDLIIELRGCLAKSGLPSWDSALPWLAEVSELSAPTKCLTMYLLFTCHLLSMRFPCTSHALPMHFPCTTHVRSYLL